MVVLLLQDGPNIVQHQNTQLMIPDCYFYSNASMRFINKRDADKLTIFKVLTKVYQLYYISHSSINSRNISGLNKIYKLRIDTSLTV